MVSILPKGKLARREMKWFWIFISPWVIGFLLFRGLPILASMAISFTKYNVASPPVFIGLDNYIDLFGDKVHRLCGTIRVDFLVGAGDAA
jgi:multiple sugar transport system permease protein